MKWNMGSIWKTSWYACHRVQLGILYQRTGWWLGTLECYKAWSIARRFHQREGQDFDLTYSPIVKVATVRTILAISVAHWWSFRPSHLHVQCISEGSTIWIHFHISTSQVQGFHMTRSCLSGLASPLRFEESPTCLVLVPMDSSSVWFLEFFLRCLTARTLLQQPIGLHTYQHGWFHNH